jgi:hypothetical protein
MSRKPDYRVAALNKITDAKNNIGGAWTNKDGSIAIKIDDFIVLHGGRELLITLFPNKDNKDDSPTERSPAHE